MAVQPVRRERLGRSGAGPAPPVRIIVVVGQSGRIGQADSHAYRLPGTAGCADRQAEAAMRRNGATSGTVAFSPIRVAVSFATASAAASNTASAA
jgi:hypothetical protein